jgi:hypothetical protein
VTDNLTTRQARDTKKVKLPREEPEEPKPSTADHVDAVYPLLPSVHRLPLLWLDWSGARVGSIEKLTLDDYDGSGDGFAPGRRQRRPVVLSGSSSTRAR